MAKDPAFLFYYQDYMVGTRAMTFEEKGAYVDLLCEQADRGKFTIDDVNRLGIGKPLWDSIKIKFTGKGGYYWNERLRKEQKKRQKYTISRKINKMNKETYVEDMLKICFSYHKDMENRNENENSLLNNIKGMLEKRTFMEAWFEWDAYRKEKRKPLTNRSIKQQILFLEKQPDPIKCIYESIKNGWIGLFEVKNGKQTGATPEQLRDVVNNF